MSHIAAFPIDARCQIPPFLQSASERIDRQIFIALEGRFSTWGVMGIKRLEVPVPALYKKSVTLYDHTAVLGRGVVKSTTLTEIHREVCHATAQPVILPRHCGASDTTIHEKTTLPNARDASTPGILRRKTMAKHMLYTLSDVSPESKVIKLQGVFPEISRPCRRGPHRNSPRLE